MDVQRYFLFLRPVVISAVACGLAGWTSRALQPEFRGSASWHPVAGAALALYLFFPRSAWRLVFAGSLFASVLDRFVFGSHYPHPFSYLLLPLLQCVGPWVSARMLSSQARGPVRFERIHDTNLLILGPCFLFAAWFAGLEVLLGWTLGGTAFSAEEWIRVWVRDALGYLIVTPLALSWLPWAQSRGWKKPTFIAEVTLGLALTVVTGWLAFLYSPLEPMGPFPFLYLPFPLLVLAALRRGPKGASLTCFVLGVTVLLHASSGGDGYPFTAHIRLGEIRWIQLYLILAGGMSLMLASITRERELTAEALEMSERRSRDAASHLRTAEQKARNTEDLYRSAISAADVSGASLACTRFRNPTSA